ncbi:MAG: hypothetical protein ACXWRR_19015 [Bdellovibrio sp.]
MVDLIFFLLISGQASYATSELATGNRLNSHQENAIAKTLPSFTQGTFLVVKAHDQCNEIQTKPTASLSWTETSTGGSSTINSLFKNAKAGIIDHVEFGKNNEINFLLKGKNLVPESINESSRHAMAYSALGSKDGFIGRMIGLVEPWNGDNIISLNDKQKKQPIHMAVLYIDKNFKKTSSSTVQCSYVSSDIPIDKIENESKCFWIDYDSRGSNGKPYCW